MTLNLKMIAVSAIVAMSAVTTASAEPAPSGQALAVALGVSFDTVNNYDCCDNEVQTVVQSLSVAAAFGSVVGATSVSSEDGDTGASAVAGSNWDSRIEADLDADRGGYSSNLEITQQYYN